MLINNPHPDYRQPLPDRDLHGLGEIGAKEAQHFFEQLPAYRPTPLFSLPALATSLELQAIYLKDEGQRLGLQSFKALGGLYAVVRLVLDKAGVRLGRCLGVTDLGLHEVREIAAELTVACATDGNHGRAVAAGAKLAGANAQIFLHRHASASRVAAITALGATVHQLDGSYDDAVAEAARQCKANSWQLVADTSHLEYETIPGRILQGYTVLVHEALQQMPAPPTHVFIQAGVGGLAAAVAAHFAARFGDQRPTVVVVEPSRAACLLESVKAGKRTRVARGEDTIMAMLECYEPSADAWRILTHAADAFMAVGEEHAAIAVQRLLEPMGSDPRVGAGASGAAGLAALMRISGVPQMRDRIGLNPDSRVFIINTEGAIDGAHL